jgi:5'(3')-deoxyribonucleotidase
MKKLRQIKEALPSVEYPQSLPKFFEDMEPMPDAIEVVNWLRKNHDVYILSAPSGKNVLSYTEKRVWVEKYFDYDLAERLILSNYKDFLKGDVLIDDHREGKGQDRFEGDLIVFGSLKYPTWNIIKKEFEKGATNE